MIRQVLAFFSAAAFEERARRRERAELVAELEELDAIVAYAEARTPKIRDRLQQLASADSKAWLESVRDVPEPPHFNVDGERITAAQLEGWLW